MIKSRNASTIYVGSTKDICVQGGMQKMKTKLTELNSSSMNPKNHQHKYSIIIYTMVEIQDLAVKAVLLLVRSSKF